MSLVVLLIAGAAFVVVMAMPLWRLSPRGGGAEWALAWSALFASGLLLRLAEAVPGLRFLYPAMGTVFAGLLFAGARRYAETALPRSFWPLLGTLAATRAVLVMVAPPLVTMLGSVAVISTAAALCAREIGRMRGRRRGGPAEGLLIVGLLALIPTSSVYEWTKFAGADLEFGFFLWLVSGAFVAGTQIAAIFEQYRTELETRLVERSEQLRASLARIEEQQRLVAIGTLAAGIAHQINNPIGAIAAAAEYALIARDDDAASIHEDALVTALEEAPRCGRIVRSVLQFARDKPMPKWIKCMNTVVVRASEPVRGYRRSISFCQFR